MAYPATIIPIMIASPADVAAEREIIRKVIARWNAANAWTSKVVLEPVSWDTHMAPGFGRPQQRINDQILAKCDLLIAVFWTRLGSPTGVAASGTIEEITAHIQAKKPAMIYFATKPVAYDPEGRDQMDRVYEFKKSLRDGAQYQEYDDILAFEQLLISQLEIMLQRDPYFVDLLKAERGAAQAALSSSDADVPRVSNLDREVTAGKAGERARLLDFAVALSKDARSVLIEAVQGGGTISIRRYLSGTQIYAGNSLMASDSSSPREVARWEAAILDLERAHMAEQVGNGLHRLTHAGWQRGDEEADELVQG